MKIMNKIQWHLPDTGSMRNVNFNSPVPSTNFSQEANFCGFFLSGFFKSLNRLKPLAWLKIVTTCFLPSFIHIHIRNFLHYFSIHIFSILFSFLFLLASSEVKNFYCNFNFPSSDFSFTLLVIESLIIFLCNSFQWISLENKIRFTVCSLLIFIRFSRFIPFFAPFSLGFIHSVWFWMFFFSQFSRHHFCVSFFTTYKMQNVEFVLVKNKEKNAHNMEMHSLVI